MEESSKLALSHQLKPCFLSLSQPAAGAPGGSREYARKAEPGYGVGVMHYDTSTKAEPRG